jgi:hypothetical protein
MGLAPVALAAFVNACSDPPPFANAGRWQDEPGDAAGFALVPAEAGVASDGAPSGDASDAGDAAIGDAGDADDAGEQ